LKLLRTNVIQNKPTNVCLW